MATGARGGPAGLSATTLVFAVAIGIAVHGFANTLVHGVLVPLLSAVGLELFIEWEVQVASTTLFVGELLIALLAVLVLVAAAWVAVRITRSRRS